MHPIDENPSNGAGLIMFNTTTQISRICMDTSPTNTTTGPLMNLYSKTVLMNSVDLMEEKIDTLRTSFDSESE
jgi:hypothetical protein